MEKPLNFMIPKKPKVPSRVPSPDIPAGFEIIPVPKEEKHSFAEEVCSKLSSRSLCEESWKHMKPKEVYRIVNERLEARFEEYKRRKGFEEEFLGYREFSTLADVQEVAKQGLRVNANSIPDIGDPAQGVVVFNSPAVAHASRFLYTNITVIIVIFRTVRGNVYPVALNSNMPPSKDHNCHMPHITNGQGQFNSVHQFITEHRMGAVYHYEYEPNGRDVEKYPASVLPHAIIEFQLELPQSLPAKSVSKVQLQPALCKMKRRPLFEGDEFPAHKIVLENNVVMTGKLYRAANGITAPLLPEPSVVKTRSVAALGTYEELQVLRNGSFGELLEKECVVALGHGNIYYYQMTEFSASFNDVSFPEVVRRNGDFLISANHMWKVFFIPNGEAAFEFGFPNAAGTMHVIAIRSKKKENESLTGKREQMTVFTAHSNDIKRRKNQISQENPDISSKKVSFMLAEKNYEYETSTVEIQKKETHESLLKPCGKGRLKKHGSNGRKLKVSFKENIREVKVIIDDLSDSDETAPRPQRPNMTFEERRKNERKKLSAEERQKILLAEKKDKDETDILFKNAFAMMNASRTKPSKPTDARKSPPVDNFPDLEQSATAPARLALKGSSNKIEESRRLENPVPHPHQRLPNQIGNAGPPPQPAPPYVLAALGFDSNKSGVPNSVPVSPFYASNMGTHPRDPRLQPLDPRLPVATPSPVPRHFNQPPPNISHPHQVHPGPIPQQFSSGVVRLTNVPPSLVVPVPPPPSLSASNVGGAETSREEPGSAEMDVSIADEEPQNAEPTRKEEGLNAEEPKEEDNDILKMAFSVPSKSSARALSADAAPDSAAESTTSGTSGPTAQLYPYRYEKERELVMRILDEKKRKEAAEASQSAPSVLDTDVRDTSSSSVTFAINKPKPPTTKPTNVLGEDDDEEEGRDVSDAAMGSKDVDYRFRKLVPKDRDDRPRDIDERCRSVTLPRRSSEEEVNRKKKSNMFQENLRANGKRIDHNVHSAQIWQCQQQPAPYSGTLLNFMAPNIHPSMFSSNGTAAPQSAIKEPIDRDLEPEQIRSPSPMEQDIPGTSGPVIIPNAPVPLIVPTEPRGMESTQLGKSARKHAKKPRDHDDLRSGSRKDDRVHNSWQKSISNPKRSTVDFEDGELNSDEGSSSSSSNKEMSDSSRQRQEAPAAPPGVTSRHHPYAAFPQPPQRLPVPHHPFNGPVIPVSNRFRGRGGRVNNFQDRRAASYRHYNPEDFLNKLTPFQNRSANYFSLFFDPEMLNKETQPQLSAFLDQLEHLKNDERFNPTVYLHSRVNEMLKMNQGSRIYLTFQMHTASKLVEVLPAHACDQTGSPRIKDLAFCMTQVNQRKGGQDVYFLTQDNNSGDSLHKELINNGIHVMTIKKFRNHLNNNFEIEIY